MKYELVEPRCTRPFCHSGNGCMIPQDCPNDRATGIKCLTCGKTSYNANDVAERYCGYCHVFHEQ